MSKEDAIAMIDAHKNQLLDPVEMLNWTWLRVILLRLDEKAWEQALSNAIETLSR